MGEATGVVLAPITGEDVAEVAEFLHRELNPRLSAEEWARAVVPPWAPAGPHHGFHLRLDGRVVGAALAFHSERQVRGRTERFCNLAAWCVAEEQRRHGLRLMRALLAERGVHFTDLSPSGNVVALNERLKFQHLDTSTALVVNVPRPSPGVRLITDPDRIEAVLDDEQRRIFTDHREAAAAHHVVLERAGRHCYVVLRRDRRKGLPLFASVLHVSDPDLLRRGWGRLSTHLLRLGIPATLAELRVVGGHRPPLSRPLARPRPKMFRSSGLSAQDVDYLYSELTCVAW